MKPKSRVDAWQLGNRTVGFSTLALGAQLQVALGQVSCGKLVACAEVSVLSGAQRPFPLQQLGKSTAGCVGASALIEHAPVLVPLVGL